MSQTFGSNQGQWQGVNSYNINCNNSYIDEISSNSLGSFIRAIGGKCKSGKTYGPYGGPEESNKFTRHHINKCEGGFNGMKIINDMGIYGIAPICNGNHQDAIGNMNIPIGNKTQFMCPSGQVINNISGIYEPKDQGFIGSMKLTCGLPNQSIESFREESFHEESFCGKSHNLINFNKLILFIILLIVIGISIYFYMKQ